MAFGAVTWNGRTRKRNKSLLAMEKEGVRLICDVYKAWRQGAGH